MVGQMHGHVLLELTQCGTACSVTELCQHRVGADQTPTLQPLASAIDQRTELVDATLRSGQPLT
jgi:hypothetical protein